MERNKKTSILWRGLSVALVLASILAMSVNVFAVSDETIVPALSEELVDSYPVRALKYLGYDVDGLLRDGLLYQDAGLGKKCPRKYRSPIYYSGNSYGTQIIRDETTVTGYAPWLENMEDRGMDCTAFAAFYYFNYLRNIEGLPVDEMWNKCFKNYYEGHPNYYALGAPRCVSGWVRCSEIAIEKGYGKQVGDCYEDLIFATNGDLIIYVNEPADDYTHVAIYIGQYDGEHYAAHIAQRGPEITRIERDSWSSSIYGLYSFDCTKPPRSSKPVASDDVEVLLVEKEKAPKVSQETIDDQSFVDQSEKDDPIERNIPDVQVTASKWLAKAIIDSLKIPPKIERSK